MRSWVFFFHAEDGIRDGRVTGVQTCALPIYGGIHVGRGARVRASGHASRTDRSGGGFHAAGRRTRGSRHEGDRRDEALGARGRRRRAHRPLPRPQAAGGAGGGGGGGGGGGAAGIASRAGNLAVYVAGEVDKGVARALAAYGAFYNHVRA